MTTSGQAGNPPGRPPAGAGMSPGAVRPSDAAAGEDTLQTVPQAEGEGTVPEDPGELKQEIERTREQLGETVEQLVAKTDVKARARNKAAELTGRAKGKTNQARAQAVARAGAARDQFAGKTQAARQRAMTVGGAGKKRLQTQATPVWEAAPEPVRRTVVKGASSAAQRRVQLAVAAAALLVGYLAFRQWRRR